VEPFPLMLCGLLRARFLSFFSRQEALPRRLILFSGLASTNSLFGNVHLPLFGSDAVLPATAPVHFHLASISSDMRRLENQ
jgi:hypothetical protein